MPLLFDIETDDLKHVKKAQCFSFQTHVLHVILKGSGNRRIGEYADTANHNLCNSSMGP